MSCAQPQSFVDQRPRFDNALKKKRKSYGNQVMGKNLIRPDKRRKVKFL